VFSSPKADSEFLPRLIDTGVMAFDVDLLMKLWNEPPREDGAHDDFGKLYADPVVINGMPTTVADLVAMARGLHAAVTDQQREVLDVAAGPDVVAVAFTVRGRHTGPLPTRLGVVPATGAAVEMAVIDIFTLVDGLITEVRAVSDELGMLSRLGAPAFGGLVDRWVAQQ
jgi:predicted ester cyclase